MGHVMITGATSGLGLALAGEFEMSDWKVTGTSNTPSDTHPFAHLYYEARNMDAHMQVVRRLTDTSLQKVDVLINNAGINAIRRFEDLSIDFMEDVMRVNCHAPVLLVREMLGAEMFTPRPVVVNIISDAAWRPMRHSEAYGTSKAAFDMATRQMARELTKPHQMSIIGIRPGKMAGTGMSRYIDEQVCRLRGWTPEEARAYFVQSSVTGLEQEPKDIARLIFNIIENPLVRSMSGACIDLVG